MLDDGRDVGQCGSTSVSHTQTHTHISGGQEDWGVQKEKGTFYVGKGGAHQHTLNWIKSCPSTLEQCVTFTSSAYSNDWPAQLAESIYIHPYREAAGKRYTNMTMEQTSRDPALGRHCFFIWVRL